MSGTKDGGKATAATNKEKYGSDYYSVIGKQGAEAYRKRQALGLAKPRGFDADRELARTAGAKGGRVTKKDYKRNEKS